MMKVNVLHQTDLFHPHCDPDDHWDLACQYALAYSGEIELKAILIDYPPAADYGDPAIQAVSQLNYISGKAIPVGIGTSSAMLSEADYTDLLVSRPEFSGVRMVIKLLEETDEPVVIHIAGSCRDIAIAGKIRPDLFKTKCRAIYLNAGASRDQIKVDYNEATKISSLYKVAGTYLVFRR